MSGSGFSQAALLYILFACGFVVCAMIFIGFGILTLIENLRHFEKMFSVCKRLWQMISRISARVNTKIKILIGYFQIIDMSAIAFGISYPPIFLDFLRMLRGVLDFNIVELLSLRCFVQNDYISTLMYMTALPLGIEVALGTVLIGFVALIK